MSSAVFQHALSNGLALVAERMQGVRSAAFTLLLPVGAARDPAGREGLAALLLDMSQRGAGPRDSRQLIADMDNLGLQRGGGVETVHTSMGAATLSSSLIPALSIYADIVRRPHLPEGELDAARALAMQELKALEDEPRHKIIVELRRRHFPYPLGRPTLGTREGLEQATHSDLLAHHARTYHPHGAILAMAGDFDWPELRDTVEQLFADWTPGPDVPIQIGPAGPQVDHIHQDTNQTQIGMACQTVAYSDPQYFQAQAAVCLLSGGSSSRLFTEVREKRGLCYAVFASYHSTKHFGSVVCYAGTTSERAQETLEVTLDQLRRLPEGITREELTRAQAGLKSALIMQGESSAARSSAVAADWFHLRRVRSFDEVQAAIDELTPQGIAEHLAEHPLRDFTVVTLGPEPLNVPT